MVTFVSTKFAVVLFTATLSTYVLIAVMRCAVSFVPTTTCTGDVTVLPFTGLHIFAPGSTVGTQLAGCLTTETGAPEKFATAATERDRPGAQQTAFSRLSGSQLH